MFGVLGKICGLSNTEEAAVPANPRFGGEPRPLRGLQALQFDARARLEAAFGGNSPIHPFQ